MNSEYVADTMAIILQLEKRRMSSKVKSIFKDAEGKKVNLFIPSIVLAEIGYLYEKKKIDSSLIDIINYCNLNSSIKIEPITAEIIYKTFKIDDIPELHDRIIAGTAYFKNIPLITNDQVIINSKFVKTIW